MSKFKAGDRVVCIEPDWYGNAFVGAGQLLTVASATAPVAEAFSCSFPGEPGAWWHDRRFVLAGAAEDTTHLKADLAAIVCDGVQTAIDAGIPVRFDFVAEPILERLGYRLVLKQQTTATVEPIPD